jgi:hypothetical protein
MTKGANSFHFTFKLLFSLNFGKIGRELKYTAVIIPIKIFAVGFVALNKLLNSFQTSLNFL